jgi:hypothetical protein
MKTPPTLLALALVLAPISALMLSASDPQPAPVAPAAVADGRLDPLMQTLQSSQQKLGRALDKQDVEVALAQTIEMQKAAQEAKLLAPPKASEISDAAKKTEFLTAYRAQMIELQRALLDLEVAVLGGKLEDGKKIFEERIKAAKKDAHAKFKD